MMVCAHGDVSEFCKARNMVVCEKYGGKIEDYRGVCPVLVTDQDMSEQEYWYLKGRLLVRGVELISTRYEVNELIAGFLAHQAQREGEYQRKVHGGRQMFGYRRVNGEVVQIEGAMTVVSRIFEMREAGYTLRQIQNDEGVHHPDGRKLSISTIQQIIKNRAKYEGTAEL